MSVESGLREAVDRAVGFFRDRATRAGVLARRLVDRPAKDDAQLADHLIRERRRKTRMDGSIEGSLVRTAGTAAELLDLGCPADHAGVVRTLGYVLARQDGPGRFGEGCSPERHERQLCRHYLRGFFSAASRDEPLAPLSFPSGASVADEEDARFAASCFALRVVLRAGEDRRATVREHLDSLLGVSGLWEPQDGAWSLDATLFALSALAQAPIQYRDRLESLSAEVIERQAPNGDWPGAGVFHALDTLLAVPTAAARDAIRRAAPLLQSRQQASGAFDADEHEERALIALRALVVATR